ncbi:MAG: tetratricopeptide repeat protein [Candidatus Omnitrophica bacterium]|nr:tetratricopeptide repeat protein [Candidatus Omnitrophota bacterium]
MSLSFLNKINAGSFKYAPILLILILGAIIYSNSFDNDFVFDDLSNIKNNPRIYHLFDFNKTENHKLNLHYYSRIIGYASFALNYQIHKLDVFGYHVVNFLIHILNTILVRWLILLILSSPKMREHPLTEHKDLIALSTALLFLTHPMQTQAVTFISQRLASLAALFYLLSLCLYAKARIRFINKKKYFSFFLISGLAALCGMFTKENTATLPLAILLYEFMFLNFPRPGVKAKKRIKGWLLPAALLLFILTIPATMSFDLSYIFGNRRTIINTPEIVTPLMYLFTQFRVICIYLRLLLFPVGQSLDHNVTLSYNFFEPAVITCFLTLIILLSLGAVHYKKNKLISFGTFFFFLTLLVESSIIPIRHVIFEHRMYLPSIGFFIVIVSILFKITKNRRIFICSVCLITAILSSLTYRRNDVWQNAITLWSDVVKKAPGLDRGYDNLGSAYISIGAYQQARKMLKKAAELAPHNPETYSNLGLIYTKQEDIDSAIKHYQHAIHLKPKFAIAHNNLGLIYSQKGEFDKTEQSFLKAIKYRPKLTAAKLNLAALYTQQMRVEEAIDLYESIQTSHPHSVLHIWPLTQLYLNANRTEEARQLGITSLQRVKNAPLLVSLGTLFAQHHMHKSALNFYQKAFQCDPSFPGTYLNLGKLYGNLEKFDKAIDVWQEGLEISPQTNEFHQLIKKAGDLASQQFSL